jgi:hypothetical protein
MILTLDKFGGLAPKIVDPLLLPANRSQIARNVRFDRGGLVPLADDSLVGVSPKTAAISLFVYYDGGVLYFFTWDTDVDAAKAPLPNDVFNRIFFTEGGIFKVTDSALFRSGGVDYPMAYLLPSPPAPSGAPSVSGPIPSPVTGLTIPVPACVESNGTFSLIFSGGGGAGAAGTYTILANVITAVSLTTGGSGYTAAPTVATQSGLGIVIAAIKDPTFIETRGYVFTLVNGYGEEGPPSPVSNLIDVFDGDTVEIIDLGGVSTLGHPLQNANTWSINGTTVVFIDADPGYDIGFQVGFNLGYGIEFRTITNVEGVGIYIVDSSYSSNESAGPGAGYWFRQLFTNIDSYSSSYNILTKRIYRLNQSASGAQYQFVAEIPVATTTHTDTTLDASLGEVLASIEWDGPPAGIKGLIALPNGVMAGFVGNLLCLSVPKYPHAWPASYQKATDRDIVALGSFGTTIIVLTEGQPYIAVGNDPANVVMERIELALSCVSKRGVVDFGEFVLYPSPQGLAMVGPSARDLLTKDLMIAEEWTALFNPSTISAYYWQGKYVGFYTLTNGAKAGFLFDPKTMDLVDLDFYATAGYHDKATGTLYLIVGGNIVSFSGANTYRDTDYLSKKFKFKMGGYGCAKVLATSYPVTLDIIYRKIPFAVGLAVASDEPVRLPTYLVDECEIRIYGSKEVSAVLLASTMEEFPV